MRASIVKETKAMSNHIRSLVVGTLCGVALFATGCLSSARAPIVAYSAPIAS
ncbi:MAG: hypothetical protein ACYDGY_05825 [Acidimicrobiales bacterium]